MTEWRKHNSSDYPENWDFETNKTIEGQYVNKRENIGKNNQTVYEVEVGGKVYCLWGSKILNEGMLTVEMGEDVRITFKGIGNSPKAIKPFKIFEVESKPHGEPVSEGSKPEDSEMPF